MNTDGEVLQKNVENQAEIDNNEVNESFSLEEHLCLEHEHDSQADAEGELLERFLHIASFFNKAFGNEVLSTLRKHKFYLQDLLLSNATVNTLQEKML